MLAVIRVKTSVKMKQEFIDTLELLRLNKRHNCVLLNDSQINMVNKVMPWLTWGEVDESTLKLLIIKRGRLSGDKRVKLSDKELDSLVKDLLSGKKKLIDFGIKPVFRLSPPKKGWEGGTVKLHYPRGAYGFRGSEINSLIKRMI